jgi:tRNA(His) 5'-end guanylyltransferase
MQYPPRVPLILRLDGVHFHSQVKKWKSIKPFDPELVSAMQQTAKYLCESISGAQIAYTQSDEITMLIRDDMGNNTEAWFNKELNKVLSDSASKATKSFIYNYFISCGRDVPHIDHLPEFDCRGYVVPENEIINAFLWRQQDCTKNSIQMLGRSKFSHKELEKKNGSDIQEMMWLQDKTNWNDLPTYLKRGTCIVKMPCMKTVPKRDITGRVVIGMFETISRPTWTVDLDIPIFSKETSYINRFARLETKVTETDANS